MSHTSLAELNYYPTNGNRWGKLRQDCWIETGITGFSITMHQITKNGTYVDFELFPTGLLVVYKGTMWDFGSGPAVNNPAMVRASLPHDMICHLTDCGLVPWSVRAQGDALLRQHIKEFTPEMPWWNVFRYNYLWRWAGVRIYSGTIAYRRREEFIA